MVGLLLVVGTGAPVLGQSEGTLPDSESDYTTEEALLRASNAEQRDAFGYAVSVDGNRAIVGARNEAGPSNGTVRGGAAYVFERGSDGWEETAILRAPDAAWGDRFGHAVALDGDWAVVGAYLADGPSGDAFNTGAAHLFRRDDGGTWSHVETLRASNRAASDRFGYAVAMDEGRVVVGAPQKRDTSGELRGVGAAYVFSRAANGTWTEEQILRASNADAQDAFGGAVALDGAWVLVGASGEAGPTNAQTDAGAAYMFERTADGTWTEARLLRASNAEEGDLFGWSVAIEGRHAVVGVHREDGPNNELRRAGAVYVFDRTNGGWPAQETALIRSPNIETNDEFGYAVDIERGRILVGAISEEGPSVGPMNAGTAYLFEQTSQGWTADREMPFRASNADRSDQLGRAVGLSGPWMVVGTASEDGPSDNMSQAGAAYSFKRLAPPRVAIGAASIEGGTEVDIEGTVRPGGAETTVHVEYREAGRASFRSVAADPSSVSGAGEMSVRRRLGELTAGTEYEVRFVAANDVGGDTSTTASIILPPPEPVATYRRTVYGTAAATDAGWRMLAQPAAGATRAALEDDLDFDRALTPILYRWDGARWQAQEQSSDPLPRGEGFIVYLSDNGTAPLDAEGRTLDVTRGTENPTADVTIDGLSQDTPVHLVGNPYETAFALDSLAGGDLPAAGFQAVVQVWNPETERFEQIVQGTTEATVPAWQGFFLQRTVVGQGRTDLTFASGGRQSGGGALIGSEAPPEMVASRSATTKQQSRSRELAVQLGVTGADGDTVSTDRATLWINDRAREGYDGYEAQDLPPPATETYATVAFPIKHQGQVLQRALAARPFPRAGGPDYRLPLSVRGVGVTGTAHLSWPESVHSRLPDEWTVALVDTQTGDKVDLRTENYSFPLGTQKALSAPTGARFEVRIEQEALPVELTTFEGTSTGQGVELRWSTASETNNAGFRVLRRANQGEWVEVGSVDGAGTTAESQTYRFSDTQVPYAADSVSYRLKQIDTDGTAHLSDAAAVKMVTRAPQLMGTYPNPARRRATVRFAVPAGLQDDEVTLRLYDMLGRQVRTVASGRVEGRQERPLDVSGLSSGVYILQLRAGGTTRTQRMTVVH